MILPFRLKLLVKRCQPVSMNSLARDMFPTLARQLGPSFAYSHCGAHASAALSWARYFGATCHGTVAKEEAQGEEGGSFRVGVASRQGGGGSVCSKLLSCLFDMPVEQRPR